MVLEIVEEGGPVGFEGARLEVAQRKREAVIDTDQRRRISAMPRRDPYFRGDGGGETSTGGAPPAARLTRSPLRLAVGV
jgi:hypothetical protein